MPTTTVFIASVFCNKFIRPTDTDAALRQSSAEDDEDKEEVRHWQVLECQVYLHFQDPRGQLCRGACTGSLVVWYIIESELKCFL